MHKVVAVPKAQARGVRFEQFLSVFQYTGRALDLVWTTSRPITVWLGALSVVVGVLPRRIAYVGKLIVDAVVHARAPAAWSWHAPALRYVRAELGLVVLLAAAQRGLGVCESLLRALLGQRVNELILEKALTLTLAEFEDSEFYDRMTRARREASSRPLSLVQAGLRARSERHLASSSTAACCFDFSVWTVVVLAAGGHARVRGGDVASPRTRFGCFAGARPKRACRPISRRCSRARTTPRR